MAAFNSANGYHSTLLHESVHATGHKSRLDRDFSKRFGDESYAFEELVAELGSCHALRPLWYRRRDASESCCIYCQLVNGSVRMTKKPFSLPVRKPSKP
jgi:antirestriction protein ArdC